MRLGAGLQAFSAWKPRQRWNLPSNIGLFESIETGYSIFPIFLTTSINRFASSSQNFLNSGAAYRNFKRHFSQFLNVSDGGRVFKRAPFN